MTLADVVVRRKSQAMGLVFVTLAALGLRLLRLGFQPLWWDEGWSLYFATTDVADLLRSTAVDIHPPLYYLLLKLWMSLFGSGPLVVRFLSVLIGTASIPFLYLAGRRLSGRKGGLLAALLLAISPLHVYYSQEVRMYGLVTLLCLASFLFSIDLVGDGPRTIVWLGYVLAASAALYTQYYAGFFLLALNLAFLVLWARARRPWRGALPWLSAQLAVLLVFLPWVLYAAQKLATYVRFKVGVEEDLPLGLLAYAGRHLAAFDWGHAEGLLADVWWLGLLPPMLLAVSVAVALKRRAGAQETKAPEQPAVRRSSIERLAPWVIVIVLLVCGFAVNRVLPFNPPRLERLLLLALPFYLLLWVVILQFLARVGRRRGPMAVVPLLALVSLGLGSLAAMYATPRYRDDDYRLLASKVQALSSPADAIICVHPWQVGYFQAYLSRDSRPTLLLTPREVLPRERQLWADEPAAMVADLDALLADHGRLWIPAHQSMGRVLEGQIESYLAEAAYLAETEWFGDSTVLSLYAAGEPQVQLVTAQFGDWLSLDAAALSPQPIEAGWGVVTAELTWRVTERPDERYSVGLRLADQSGRIWAKRDSYPVAGLQHFYDLPAGEPQVDRYGVLVPAGTPPGDYHVTLQVYRSHDVAVLPVSFPGGSGGEVTLGMVRIIRAQTPPPPEALAPQKRMQVDFDNRLRLLGVSLGAESGVLPGESVDVDLFWEALAAPREDFLPRLQLLGDGSEVAAEKTEKPVSGTYPTAWWQEGELVRDPHALPVPAAVPEGIYHVNLSLILAVDGSSLDARPGKYSVDLGQIEVKGRTHEYWPPIPSHPERIVLGSSVELVGYDVQEAARAPGSPLEVTLHWHALETPDRNYWAFVHLLSGDGEQMQIVAQHDGTPGDGGLPTLGWLRSEYLSDTHLLQLPFDLEDGTYHLGVGLYDPLTSERLGERVLLDATIPVNRISGCKCQ